MRKLNLPRLFCFGLLTFSLLVGGQAWAISFHFASGAVGLGGSDFWMIQNNIATKIGPVWPNHVNAIDQSPSGVLFGAASGDFIQIEPLTGQGNLVGPMGVHLISLAFTPNGELWGGSITGGLYNINTSTGSANFVATLPFELVGALAATSSGEIIGWGRDFCMPESAGQFFSTDLSTLTSTLLGAPGAALESLDFAPIFGFCTQWDAIWLGQSVTLYRRPIHSE